MEWILLPRQGQKLALRLARVLDLRVLDLHDVGDSARPVPNRAGQAVRVRVQLLRALRNWDVS
jgi:hypothetical protein